MKGKRIIVTGYMARCPVAGVVWQHIHYIVGLQQLGHEVFYIEDSTAHPYNPRTWEWSPDYSFQAEIMPKLARQFGFEGRWGYRARFLDGRPCVGLSGPQIDQLYREADCLINVCGEQELQEDLLRTACLIYVESDPGKEQCEIDNNPASPIYETLRQYHAVFTFGEHIGTGRFPVPLHGIPWKPTRQPVVTDLWKADSLPASDALLTSVANWNTKGKDIEWRGDKYLWSKALEFLRFAQAPVSAGEPLQLATNLRDPSTIQLLEQSGWRLVDPDPISAHHDGYKAYLQGSKGEFTVAKDQYVRLDTGWFSDRSACYLAAGRPVVTQETGFSQLYGGKGGLFGFSTLEEIGEAVREINADYTGHCRAAHEVAVEHFEATKVLGDLLHQAGV